MASVLTNELVVLSAYEITRPTRPASTPLVIRAPTASEDEMKIIAAPMNSRRTASHRLTDVLGK